MNHVYYWKGAVGTQALLEQHHEDISRLLRGDYPHTDLEKLRGNPQHKLYSFRINRSERLLFTTRKIDGKHYLHVLEYLPTHQYNRSRFLQHRASSDYLDGQTEAEFDTLTLSDDKPIFETGAESITLQPIALDYFNKQFIQVRDEQQEIIHQPLPLIINGVSGCGKTYIALSVLDQFITNYSGDKPARILYVTKEINLVNTIKQNWHDFNPKTSDLIQSEFLTYNEVLAQYARVDAYADEMSHYRNWLNTQKKSSTDIDDHLLFNEFRLCAGFSQEQYENLGEHQSNASEIQRKNVYQQYQRYQNYLIHEEIVDPLFYTLAAEPTYALIVVDEAQNLALRQLHNLHQLAINQAILYCMDPQQNLIDQAPIRKLLQHLNWTLGHQLPSIQLNRTYRCATQITLVVNTLLQAKHDILGKIDKTEAPITHDPLTDNGYVALTTSKKIHNDHQAILNRNITNHFAVITHGNLRQEAEELFQTALVFTVKEIQGLEYHTVLVYKLLSDEASQKNLKIIHPPLINSEIHKHSKQEKEEHQNLAPWFNALYTAYTRAQHTLLICENVPKNLNGLIQFLQKNGLTATPLAAPIQATSLPATNWEQEARRQQEQGNEIIAAKIRARNTTAKKIPSVTINTAQFTKAKARHILDHFTEKDVIKDWIHSPDFISILFETPFSLNKQTDQNLFAHIAQSNEHLKRFNINIGVYARSVMTPAFISQALTQKNLPDVIEDKIKLHLVKTDPSMLDMPSIKNSLLCYLNKHLRKINLHLTVKKDTQEFIQVMIDHQIFDKSTIDAFVKNLTEAASQTQLTELLLLAIDNPTLLKNLINNYPDIIPTIPVQIWYWPPSNEAKYFYQNTSIVYWLSQTPDGCAILQTLVDEHPNIINAIPPDAWTRSRTHTAGRLENTSTLFYLSSNYYGRTILTTLIQKYPDIINAMSPKAWGLPLTRQTGENENISPLHLLAAIKDGRAILQTLIDTYPNLIQSIPSAAWSLARTSQAGDYENTSPLTFLAENLDGLTILRSLIDKFPAIIDAIPSQAWSLPLTSQAGAYENSSSLYSLTTTREGCAIFSSLIDKHTHIMRDIPTEAWTLTPTSEEADLKDSSPVINLMTLTDRAKRLETIQKLPNLAEAFSIICASKSNPIPLSIMSFLNKNRPPSNEMPNVDSSNLKFG